MSEGSESPERRFTRRRFVAAALGGVGALAGGGYAVARATRDDARPPVGAAASGDRLAEFANNIRSGGPPKDGIPPIDEPEFVSASEARFLSDDDVVFGLVHDGEARAYPQLVLVWHEIVNDEFRDGPITVTYCPLTGSAVAFRGSAPTGDPYTFGTSGDLVNSNLLMYDRQTDSRWPQLLAQAITGPARGQLLTETPLDWTTWKRWSEEHPDTRVLSTKTGHLRNYGQDPYGSYTPVGGYYAEGSGRFFPVMHEDPRLDDKAVVVGVKLGRDRVAVRKDVLRERNVVSRALAGKHVALLYDPELDEGRAFLAEVRRKPVRLEPTGEARYADESGTVWDASGRSTSAQQLRRLVSYDVMWFAWAAFFPETEVVA